MAEHGFAWIVFAALGGGAFFLVSVLGLIVGFEVDRSGKRPSVAWITDFKFDRAFQGQIIHRTGRWFEYQLSGDRFIGFATAGVTIGFHPEDAGDGIEAGLGRHGI